MADTNCLISAIIKDSVARKILLNRKYNFISPDVCILEIIEHKEEISQKSLLEGNNFESVFNRILSSVTIVPVNNYDDRIIEASLMIKDPDDVAFMALALALNADGIWSNDKEFLKQDRVKVYPTGQLMNPH